VGVQIGTAVLVRVSVSVWNWQYGNSGLVGVQIGTAVLVRFSVSVWNWQYGNSGLVGVQIGTAVLVKFTVQLFISTWIVNGLICENGVICSSWKQHNSQCVVLSEQCLIFSFSFQITP
jgi:hypothetical protein